MEQTETFMGQLHMNIITIKQWNQEEILLCKIYTKEVQ
jgi:hypothetical protein